MRRKVICVCRRSAFLLLRWRREEEKEPRIRSGQELERVDLTTRTRKRAARTGSLSPLPAVRGEGARALRNRQGGHRGQSQTQADDRALCGPVRGGEGAATPAFLRRLRTVASLRAQTVPAQSHLPRRSAGLPGACARRRAARTAAAGAAGHFGGDAGKSRRTRTHGAAVHAARSFRRHRRPGRDRGVQAAAFRRQDRSRRRKCAYASTSAR